MAKTSYKAGHKGFTLVELMIAMFMSALVIAMMTGLFTTSLKTFNSVKEIADTKETGLTGMAQLEWIFQRWGTSTPCFNAANPLVCTQVQSCAVSGTYAYPPPSSICITITTGSPCDEAVFYANLAGNGFVYNPQMANPAVMDIKSCRLSASSEQNCYHIKRGARFLVDQQTPASNTPLIFKLNDLSTNNAFCTDGTILPNSTVSVNTTVVEGGSWMDAGGALTTTYPMEGGEVLLRVPHRIRIFCQNFPADNNRLWLYMEATDMAATCNAVESAQPLVPVNSFKLRAQGNGVWATFQARGQEGKTMDVQRFFAR